MPTKLNPLPAFAILIPVTYDALRYTATGLLAAVCVIALLVWPVSTNRPSPNTLGSSKSQGPGLYQASLTSANFGLLGVNFYETAAHRKHWNIRSAFAELHRKESYAFLKEVDADFYAQRTGNVVHTTSDYGRSWLEKRLVHLEGHVVIRSRFGYLFTMNELDYTSADHQFRSPDWVTMRGPDIARPELYLRGLGLTADIDREHFRLRRKVTARKRMPDSGWMNIASQSGEFLTNDQLAIFTGKVRSVLPKLELESDEFRLFSGGVKERVEAQGNVKLTSRDRVGYADKALIELGGDQITLAGQARVMAKGNEILGQVIRIYTDDDRIEVEKAQGRVNN